MLKKQWCGRLKWHAGCLEAFFSSVFFNIAKMFAKEVGQFSFCFFYVDLFAKSTGYAADDISGDDVNRSVMSMDRLNPAGCM